MKRLLYIAGFLSAFVLMLWALDSVYTFGLRHNQNLKITQVMSSPPRADLLFHGPCEPLWMISPAMVDKHTNKRSYNLALSHSDFADNYIHLYLYLKHNPAPAHLFLFVTPESFDTRYNTFNTYRFAHMLNEPVVFSVVKENDPGYARLTVIPFMRYAYYNRSITFYALQGWKHYFTGRKEAYYPDGFEPPAKRLWGNHAGEFVNLYKKDTYFSVDSLRTKYLVKIIQLAREHKVNIHLYESPVLAESLSSQPNRDAMIRWIRETAATNNVDYIQFDSLELSKRKEYFISTLSLNMEGVSLFNDTLGKFLYSYCKEH